MRHIVSEVIIVAATATWGLAAGGLSCGAMDPVQTPQVVLTEEQQAEQSRVWEERAAARRAADVKIFLIEFEAGQKLTVRERLDRAATVTGELATQAEKLAGNQYAKAFPHQSYPSRYAIYPRASHIARLTGIRPWLRDYPKFRNGMWALRRDTVKYQWPAMRDREELKRLLEDDDPDIGIMAAEALATLYEPEDLYELRSPDHFHRETQLSTPTIPVLSTHHPYGDFGAAYTNELKSGNILTEDDPLMYPWFWKQVTVGEYYDRALQQLTGAMVTGESLHQWTKQYGDNRECVWYWEYRFYRDYYSFMAGVEPVPPHFGPSDENLAAIREPLLAEIASLGRLTEARILLSMSEYRNELEPHEYVDWRFFFGPPWKPRLTRDEVFRLLQGERLWPHPRSPEQAENYEPSDSQLVTRLMYQPRLRFSEEGVPRLQKVLTSTTLKLSPNAIAEWHIAISQLLLPADPNMTDDAGTRDGYLRQQIRENGNSTLVSELTRVGLPANAAWLKELFFTAGKDNSPVGRFSSTILSSLGGRPHTRDQRLLLWSLITDDRFRTIWTQGKEYFKDGRRRDKSLYSHRHPACVAAFHAVNAHAGKEFFSYEAFHGLVSPGTCDAHLESLLRKLKAYPASD